MPKFGDRDAFWAAAEDCCLGGPENLISKTPIDQIYASTFSNQGIQLGSVFQFFREVFKMPSYIWANLVDDICLLKEKGCVDVDRVKGMYARLAKEVPETDRAKSR